MILGEESYTLCITEHTHPPELDKIKNREVYPFNTTLLTPPQPRRSFKKEDIKEEYDAIEMLE